MNNFIFWSIVALAPIGVFLLNWVLFFIGKFLWWILVGFFPKLKPQVIDIIMNGYADLLYFDTAIFFLFLIFVVIKIVGG